MDPTEKYGYEYYAYDQQISPFTLLPMYIRFQDYCLQNT
jgi:hypothetical protein